MPLELFVSRRATRGVERIVHWWAVNRPAAPGAVRRDLRAARNLLLVQPDIGIRVKEASSPDVRRASILIASGIGSTTVFEEIASNSCQCGIPVATAVQSDTGYDSSHMPTKVKELLTRLEADGWLCVRQKGSHRQYRHPSKPGTVTVAGKPSIEVPPGTLSSILKQAGLKR